MMSRRASFGWLVLLVASVVPVAVSGQAPPDPVSPTVNYRTVDALFGAPPDPVEPRDLETERVEITVATPTVDSVFRSTIQVDVITDRGPIDPDGYLVTIASVDGPSWFEQRPIPPNGTVRPVLEPGRYTVRLEGLMEGCEVVSMESEPWAGGLPERVVFVVQCDPPPSLRVAVSESIAVPDEEARVQLVGTEAQAIPVGSSGDSQDLAPGPNELLLVLPDPIPQPSGLNVGVGEDTPDALTITVDGGSPKLLFPNDTVPFPRVGAGPITVSFDVPPPSEDPRPTIVALEVKGGGAEALEPGDVTIRVGDGEAQPVDPTSGTRLTDVTADSIQIVLDLDADFGARDGWYLSAGLGAIAVAATNPKSFITPTVGLSLLKGPERAEWLHLNAQVGYWRSGPSGADPVLPEDPRPPFRNRTIWTWAVGASVFPGDWGGLGVSASWVEGRETASEEEKYINRSRGVAVGPRFRLLTQAPWPSVIFGLDAQYGEADELRQVEPEWGWSLTPILSLSYVFR